MLMADKQQETERVRKRQGGGISIRIIGAVAIVIAIALAFHAFALASSITDANQAAKDGEKRYVECSDAVDNLQTASDYLTTQARLFITTVMLSHSEPARR